LEVRFRTTVISIYECGAAKRQGVGRPGAAWSFIPWWSLALVWDVRTGGARLVVPKPVVPAWCDGSWCGSPVVSGLIVCWAWF